METKGCGYDENNFEGRCDTSERTEDGKERVDVFGDSDGQNDEDGYRTARLPVKYSRVTSHGAEQPHHRHQQEQAHQGQGYDLYDGHTSPPFIAPAATQGGADGSVFSTGTACGMPEGTLWPFCSLIRRSR
mgnify:CR=1 FL=1